MSALKEVFLFQGSAADGALLASRVGVVAALWTGDDLGGDASIGAAVAEVHLKDLLVELVLGDDALFADELPHGLAGKGEAVDMTAELQHVVGEVLGPAGAGLGGSRAFVAWR